MPKLTLYAAEKGGVRAISPEILEEYKGYVSSLDKEKGLKGYGELEFDKGEDIKLGRRALTEAGIQLGKHVKVTKVRGSDNTLRYTRISKQEFDAAKASAEARAEKMRGKKRTPAKAKK